MKVDTQKCQVSRNISLIGFLYSNLSFLLLQESILQNCFDEYTLMHIDTNHPPNSSI